DKNKDGVISQKELEEIFSLTLDGSIITEIDSLKDLSKLVNLNHISIINWKNFNPVLLCDVKQVTYIQLTDSTFAECSEKVDHINHIDIFNTEDFDLNSLKPFTNLLKVSTSGTTVKNLEALKELDLKRLYIDAKVDSTEVAKYIKASDYELPEGFLCPLAVRPAGAIKGKFTVTDPETVKFTNYSASTFTDSADEDYCNFIYSEKTGETEYQYSDKDGNKIGTGKIKVIENKPVDEPLDAENKRTVRIISDESSDQKGIHERWAYLLFDDGIMYTYNKEGKGELTPFDENVSDIRNDSYGNQIVLYKDGTLKINGDNITENFKVVTASEYMTNFLCSDGIIRTVSGVVGGGYKVNKIMSNVKAMCPSNPDLIQTKDGKTALMYSDKTDGENEYSLFELNLKINPVSCVKGQSVVTNGGGFLFRGGTFYVTDDKNDLYMIKAEAKTSSKEITKSVGRALIASDVAGCGYLYRRGEGTNQKADIAYTDKEGKAYSCTNQGEEIKAENGFDLFDNKQYDYETRDTRYMFTENTTASGNTVINDDSVLGISLRTADGTENFTCLDRFASFTHVKESTGTFFDGSDYTILITREDNTLWKYSIEAGTFTRLDDQIKKGDLQENPPKEEPEKKYNTKDIVSMMQYIFGAENAVKEDWMDFDGNGKVNIIDLLLLKKEILRSLQ
ncbi:MAG: hypothetical protein ILP22_08830, partial [Oscillospiraceae bacterium]|nr:hypothetical protein [Oscillospiraceae bacterium]